MTWLEVESPAPRAGGGRASELVSAGDFDRPEDRPSSRSVQPSLPPGFEPGAFPIIARHWLGLTPEG